MFEVIFEVHPRPEKFDVYLSTAKGLKPILESQRGFIENIRYKSLTRVGWILSLSDWEDEKALVRWRTQMGHHRAQERGRDEILADYHLRVGEVTADASDAGVAHDLQQQRLDQTETGEAKVISLVNLSLIPLESGEGDAARDASEVLKALAFDPSKSTGLVSWDAFEAILFPGQVLLLCSWTDQMSAEEFGRQISSATRTRTVRVIRDYGMFDRVEAPQYYPEVKAK